MSIENPTLPELLAAISIVKDASIEIDKWMEEKYRAGEAGSFAVLIKTLLLERDMAMKFIRESDDDTVAWLASLAGMRLADSLAKFANKTLEEVG